MLVSGLYGELDRHLLLKPISKIFDCCADQVADAPAVNERSSLKRFQLSRVQPYVYLALSHAGAFRRTAWYAKLRRCYRAVLLRSRQAKALLEEPNHLSIFRGACRELLLQISDCAELVELVSTQHAVVLVERRMLAPKC